MVVANHSRLLLTLIISAVALARVVDGFVGSGGCQLRQELTSVVPTTQLSAHEIAKSASGQSSAEFSPLKSVSCAPLMAAGFIFFAGHAPCAVADDIAAPPNTQSFSIEKCSTSSKSPCVSTSNVRQLDLYSPPWTFPSSYGADEIMSRLKGAVVADSSCEIVKQEGSQYLEVHAKRPADIFGTIDNLEFVVNAADQVVTFRSSAPSESTSTDFGLQRKRLDEIRKRAGIFGVMGESMNTADSATTGERGNGPLGQLKAFYGLQSGGGFEDVLAE